MTLPVAPRSITKLDVAVEDYSFDFTPVLAVGDSVASSVAPLVRLGDVVAAVKSLVGNVITIRLSGGTAATSCEVVIQVITTGGAKPAWALAVQIVG
jgi:hypothetical protein